MKIYNTLSKKKERISERLEKLFSKKNTSDREVSLMLLGEMMAYAESSISRRKFLLNYFGEEYDPGKDNIDILDDNLRFPKEKIEAKEYLSILLNVWLCVLSSLRSNSVF